MISAGMLTWHFAPAAEILEERDIVGAQYRRDKGSDVGLADYFMKHSSLWDGHKQTNGRATSRVWLGNTHHRTPKVACPCHDCVDQCQIES